MKVSIGIGGAAIASGEAARREAEFARDAEKLGVDVAWSAEGWGTDAVSPIAYLAAITRKIRLGTGIMQLTARTPAMTAMTAMTLSGLTDGRFVLGLGASGPQVVEGLHNTSFRSPVKRMRETLEIMKQAFRGDKLALQGAHYRLPLPGGEGKKMRLAFKPKSIPIYLATVAPRGLELSGEVADGWLGTSFMPESSEAHFKFLRRGAIKRKAGLGAIDLCAGGSVCVSDDLASVIRARKNQMAYTLGAMGSPKTNFYFRAYCRAGFEDDCKEVQSLWLKGNREEASRRVPEEMILRTNFFGNEEMIRNRIKLYRDVGITTLRMDPLGRTYSERLDTLEKAVSWVRDETLKNKEPRET